jgi:hypothetical protein
MNQQYSSAFRICIYMKRAPREAGSRTSKNLSLFADLIAHRAGSLASGLAGSRAFTAAAAAQGLFQHFFIYSFDSLCHVKFPPDLS